MIGTGADGQFLFANVSGNDDYFVYGIMSSLGQRGGISERRVHASGDGSECKLGDLAVEPAFRLSGRFVLADGKPLGAKSVGRNLAQLRGRIVGGRCIDSHDRHGGAKGWYVRQADRPTGYATG